MSRWYSRWAPEWAATLLRRIWPDRMSEGELVAQMDTAVHIPGVANSWTMPVRGRVVMLSTGLRNAIGSGRGIGSRSAPLRWQDRCCRDLRAQSFRGSNAAAHVITAYH